MNPPHRDSQRPPLEFPVELLHRPGAMLRIRPRVRGRYRQSCNHVYAEALGAGLTMDIFHPLEGGNGLGVVDVVSSGWQSDRVVLHEHLGLGIVDALCAAGFTVFAVSPGSTGLFCGADMVLHVHAALRHIKAHAGEWGIRADRLGVTGASAGAHLAALAQADPQRARPDSRDLWRRHDTTAAAAAFFFPPADLMDYGGRRFDHLGMALMDVAGLLFRGGAISGHGDANIVTRLEHLSPVRVLAHFKERHPGTAPAPTLLFHGTVDPLVPVEQASRLIQALRDAGGQAELVLKEGGGHPWLDNAPELAAAVDWFTRHLGG